jgi:C-methyltransferase C-terminal domain/Methyltransferase domain
VPSLPTSSFISCIACASPSTLPVAEIPPTAIDTNRIWPSRTEALSAAKAPINLTYCTACGHVFNRDYNDDLVNYEDDYENSQMFSPKFRKYCEELSDRLITNYNVYRKHVVEIGGGKGDFLRIICDRGNNSGVSFGPSYRPSPGDDIPANVSFVTDYYTEKYAGEPADLIICRHVLEHCWEPRGIITTVRQAIGDRRDLVVYFEVPNGDFILREQAFWDFCYQHCSYFTKTSLTKMFIEHGFEVREVREDFGGQFLAIEAGAAADDIAANGYTLREGEEATAAASWQAFGADFNARAASWRDNLERLRAEGQRVIAWGAGAKAVTFLNIVDPAGDAISHIVDINPRKMGCFVSSSGQEIVAPNALQELRPKVILLMNAIYRDEIGSAVRALGLDPLFLVA